jgi:hypothetical protein
MKMLFGWITQRQDGQKRKQENCSTPFECLYCLFPTDFPFALACEISAFGAESGEWPKY